MRIRQRPFVDDSVSNRFWKHIDKQTNGCWVWTGSIFKNGYGRMRFGKYTRVSHRVAYELTKGDIPEGMLVCHSCDIRRCCNPDHLFLGTDADNVHDCQSKGRRADISGENHPMAKLNKEDVLRIRGRRSEGEPLSSIAKDFNVTNALISLIDKRKAWRTI
jgi:hypothetical protein